MSRRWVRCERMPGSAWSQSATGSASGEAAERVDDGAGDAVARDESRAFLAALDEAETETAGEAARAFFVAAEEDAAAEEDDEAVLRGGGAGGGVDEAEDDAEADASRWLAVSAVGVIVTGACCAESSTLRGLRNAERCCWWIAACIASDEPAADEPGCAVLYDADEPKGMIELLKGSCEKGATAPV